MGLALVDDVNQESPSICLTKQPKRTPMVPVLLWVGFQSFGPVSALSGSEHTDAQTRRRSPAQLGLDPEFSFFVAVVLSPRGVD